MFVKKYFAMILALLEKLLVIKILQVDGYLEELTKFTKEAEQTNILKKVAKR